MPPGSPECPKNFSGRHRTLWENYVQPAYWLTQVDEPKAIMFVHLLAEFLAAPNQMLVTRIRQLRLLGSELGFDPPSRARMGREQDDPFERYK
jgi:hypothetical protein